jgi:nucleoporin p58/p45
MEILTTLAGSVQRDRSLADKLKQDTAKALQNAEIAQRTHDTPTGLQYENNTPLLFFMELSENFEHDLMLFKSQIEATEKHIQTMMSPKTLTPQGIKNIF